jgi:hypothetical protein
MCDLQWLNAESYTAPFIISFNVCNIGSFFCLCFLLSRTCQMKALLMRIKDEQEAGPREDWAAAPPPESSRMGSVTGSVEEQQAAADGDERPGNQTGIVDAAGALNDSENKSAEE